MCYDFYIKEAEEVFKLKITFSITLSEFPNVDETTAKEILPAYLENGIKVKTDDIIVLSIESEAIDSSHPEKKDKKQPTEKDNHHTFIEQTKQMED